jgi:hypothetical protein
LRNHIENVGKQALEQSGKHRVNKNDEEKLSRRANFSRRRCGGSIGRAL